MKKTLSNEDILEKQKALHEQLDSIYTQIEELESDDEDKSPGRLSRASSASTISVELPDFFGNSNEFDCDETFSNPRPSNIDPNQAGVEVVSETHPRIMFNSTSMDETQPSFQDENLPPALGRLYIPPIGDHDEQTKDSQDSQSSQIKMEISDQPAAASTPTTTTNYDNEKDSNTQMKSFSTVTDTEKDIALRMETLQQLKDLSVFTEIVLST